MNDTKTIQEEAILYLEDSQNICDTIDLDVEKLEKYENQISNLQAEMRFKRQLIKEKSLLTLYILTTAFFFVLFSLISIFTSYWLILVSIPCGIISIIIFKYYYRKKVLPVYEEAYNKVISETFLNASEIVEDMFVQRNMYEELLQRIPKQSRHPIAINIMKESLYGNFTYDVDDAAQFYNERYEIIKLKTDEAAQSILEEIESSELKSEKRLEILSMLDEKFTLYNI